MPVMKKDYDQYNGWTTTDFTFVEVAHGSINKIDAEEYILIDSESKIYNLSGTLVATGSINGLQQGVYIVKNDSSTHKIFIK